MDEAESLAQAHAVFNQHRETCQQCGRYDGTPATLARLCLKGVDYYRETVKPQHFAGQRK
jgi:ribosomal protein S14